MEGITISCNLSMQMKNILEDAGNGISDMQRATQTAQYPNYDILLQTKRGSLKRKKKSAWGEISEKY